MIIVSRKRLIKEALAILCEEDTSKAWDSDNLMYRMGNANALNGLSARLGIDLTKEAKKSNYCPNCGARMDGGEE